MTFSQQGSLSGTPYSFSATGQNSQGLWAQGAELGPVRVCQAVTGHRVSKCFLQTEQLMNKTAPEGVRLPSPEACKCAREVDKNLLHTLLLTSCDPSLPPQAPTLFALAGGGGVKLEGKWEVSPPRPSHQLLASQRRSQRVRCVPMG